jgi:small subunit ribosomal protein S4
MALVLESLASNERDFCEYVAVEVKSMTASFIRAPELSEVPYPVKMEPNLVIEFYAS